MSIEKISSINNNINFKGVEKKPEETAAKTPAEIKDGKKKLALALGALGVIALGTAAIVYHKKLSPELNIKKFKKLGGFEKTSEGTHLAMYKNKPFTGSIKSGDYTLQYENGVLKSSAHIISDPSKDSKAITSISEKVYSYNENGKLESVNRYRYYNSANGADKFTIADLHNGGAVGKNITVLEEGSLKIEDGKVTVKNLTKNHDALITKQTFFDKDGTMKEKIISEKKLDKDKVADVIKSAGEKQTAE